MTWVRLGNTLPREGYFATPEDEVDNIKSYRPIDGPSITTLLPPDGLDFGELLNTIILPQGVWFEHAQHEPDETGLERPVALPAWVSSDDPLTARRLAAFFDCPAEEPADFLHPESIAAIADQDLPGLDQTATPGPPAEEN